VWLGVSVESQKYFHRAATLGRIPAMIRFISAEPLLAVLDVLQLIDGQRVIDNFQWLIIGGESGYEAGKYLYRPCEIPWVEKIINDVQAEAPHVAVFVKQLGLGWAKENQSDNWHGGKMEDWLKNLQMRDYPISVAA
jgi:protein gp37